MTAESPADIERLRQCISELSALSALPAVWVDYAAKDLAASLAEVLCDLLHLEFAFVRLTGGVEVSHRPAGPVPAELVEAMSQKLSTLGLESGGVAVRASNPVGAGFVHLLMTPVGVGGEHGVVVTASIREDFPGEVDRVVVSVGTNQAALALQRREAEESLTEERRKLTLRTSALEAEAVRRRRAEAALKLAHDQLEQRVVSRTQDLQVANARLQELDRTKSEFMATVSHEFRTPLNAIIGFSELLMTLPEGELSAAERHEFLEYIVSGGNMLLDLVNDILDLTRVEAGRLALDLARVDVSQLVTRAVHIILPQASAKHITVTTDIGMRPTLEVDAARLNQILVNLLTNAVKFTPDAGSIHVCIRPVEGLWAIDVRDTGIGIPAGDLARVFDPFEQGRNRQPDTPGTGLGLAICRKLAEAHGGTLHVHSTVGLGSIFTLVLPAPPTDQASIE